MKGSRIFSPMPTGNGAYIVHRTLENLISGYTVKGYNPFLTLMPFLLKFAVGNTNARLIHTAPDYACFCNQPSKPLIITFHNYVLDSWMRPYSSILQNIHFKTDLRLFTKIAVSRAHTITAVSKYTANLVKKDLKITKNIRVIYNGINTKIFYPVLSPRAKNNVNKEIRVFFSGNLTRRKGVQWLPAISKRLSKNIQILYTQGLRSKRVFLPGKKLKNIGTVDFKDMPNFYRDVDILLMPTVREGFGLAVAEAMACGLPVVASNCSSIPELIDDGKGGFLCPVGDVDAFAEKVNLLADSPNLRREMGDYNRSKVEKMFTLDRMVNEYRELFEEVLSE